MDITGKIYKVLPVEDVNFAQDNSVRKAQTFVITDQQSGRYVAFRLWGEDRIAMLRGLDPGRLVTVSFRARSRERRDRPDTYMTELSCFMIVPLESVIGETPVPLVYHPETPAQQMKAAGAPTAQQTFGAVPQPTDPVSDTELPF